MIKSIINDILAAHAGWSFPIVSGITLVLCLLIAGEAAESTRGDNYWHWRSAAFTQQRSDALDLGLNTLERDPSQGLLYWDVSELCIQQKLTYQCIKQISSFSPRRPKAYLYRKLALSRLYNDADSLRSAKLVAEILAAREIGPQIMRRVLDDIQGGRVAGNLDTLLVDWKNTRDQLSPGQRFGLAYILSRRSDWKSAERTLLDLTGHWPRDESVSRELGRIYFFQRRRDECFRHARRAVEIARAAGNLASIAQTSGNLATVMLAWGAPRERIRDLLHEALSFSERAGDLDATAWNLYRLAELSGRDGNYRDALQYLDRSERVPSLGHSSLPVRIASLRGFILYQMGHYADAIDELYGAINSSEAFPDDPVVLQAQIYLAQVLSSHGDHDEALQVARAALQEARSHGYRDDLINLHNVIGIVQQRAGRYGSALREFTQALEVANDDESSGRICETYSYLGYIHACLNNLQLSKYYFKHALEISRTIDDTLVTASSLIGLGHNYASVNRHEEAIKYFQSAYHLIRRSDKNDLIASLHMEMARSRLALGDSSKFHASLDMALSLSNRIDTKISARCMKAMEYIDSGKYSDAIAQFEHARKIRSENGVVSHDWALSYGRAILFWKKGRLREAEAQFRIAIASVEQHRSDVISVYSRGNFMSDKLAVFESFSTFLEEQGRFVEAADVSERGRARSLLDLIFSTQRARGSIDGDREEQALEAVSILRAQSTSTHMPSNELTLKRQEQPDLNTGASYAEDLLRQIDVRLQHASPEYVYAPAPIRRVQNSLERSEALLVYDIRTSARHHLAPSTVYVVHRDEISAIRLHITPNELKKLIVSFRASVAEAPDHSRGNWKQTAAELHRAILRPALQKVPNSVTHLHIVPEGVLHYLPFSALIGENNEYLIEAYTLSITPSVTILELSKKKNPLEWENILLLADSRINLPGAAHEVLNIAEATGPKARVVLGDQVTQENISKLAPRYDIIHFATHGRFRRRNPIFSHLELHNGSLTVDKIGGLGLNAYLVTLSACESALSSGIVYDLPPGEEFVGLYQAFLAAGTPTVLASLWSINDRYSGPLMSRFYKHLVNQNKAESLALAQRSFIAHAQTRHPYYWASFVVVGDPR